MREQYEGLQGRSGFFEEAFGARDLTTSAMRLARNEWLALYYDSLRGESSMAGEDGCLRLPVVIVNKLYKSIFGEYSATAGGGYPDGCLRALDAVRRQAVQQMLAGGECLIKPVPTQDGMRFVVLPRDCFAPLARDEFGALTSVGTAETVADGRWFYHLLERRTVLENGDLMIESKLYRSDSRTTPGTEVGLAALARYAGLLPVLVLPGMHSLGLADLRTPLPNCVDGSPDAVAVFAPAAGLIHSINRNEWLLAREFELGRSRVIASADLLAQGRYGGRRLEDDLFVGLDDDSDTVGITIFSPVLREESYLARKREYLRSVESLIGLKRGLLSDVEAEARTATEITSTAGEYSLTIEDFQREWERMLLQLLPDCVTLGRLYGVPEAGEAPAYEPAALCVDWGDGVLFDRTRTWAEYSAMVDNGLLRPEIALGWYFNLPCETEEECAEIREKWMGRGGSDDRKGEVV